MKRHTPISQSLTLMPTKPAAPKAKAAAPVFFATPHEFRAWLCAHAATASELIVGFAKAHTGKASITWPQSVDEALSFGWIDGVRTRIDDEHYQIRFTPRKAGSHWSAVNIARVPELQAEGRMTPAGLAAFALRTVEKSAKGSYEQTEFPELSAAETKVFKQNKAAWAFYEKLPPSYRRKVNWLIISAKQQATRDKRFRALVADCEAGRRMDRKDERRGQLPS
jgi:uncharacterized protein YdeI (YjbR/CyaY-like superfamily)